MYLLVCTIVHLHLLLTIKIKAGTTFELATCMFITITECEYE